MVEQIHKGYGFDALASSAIEGGLLELEKDKCERARAGEHGNQETWVTDGRTDGRTSKLIKTQTIC